jgi:putative membrane protein
MDQPDAPKSRDLKQQTGEIKQQTGELKEQTGEIKRSTEAVEKSAVKLTDSADRRTELAGDRTLLASERTYAAWVRTALAALAAGVGSAALVHGVLPELVGKVTGSVLVVFAGFCLVAAVWRELQGLTPKPPDVRPLPHALLVPMNFFLLLVAIAALVGIWSA